MRKRSGRSNASAAKTVARSENCRARAFRSLLLGMLFRRLCGCDRSSCGWQSAGVLPLSACQRYDSFISTATFVHTANGRARAFRSLLLGMLFRRLRGRDRSFCEWQSAGVLRLLYDRGTIPSSAPARLYIRRMAERRRSAPCCWGCGSDACAGRVRTVRERRALPLRRIWSVFAAGDTALFCRGVGFPGRDVPKSIPLFRERSFGRRWQLSD